MEVSLCNYETGPLIVDTKRGDKKVTISIINRIQAKLRKVHKLKVNDDWSLEAIMIPKMKLWLQTQEIPDIWHKLDGTWAEQDTYTVSAQILLVLIKQDSFLMKPETSKELYYKQIRLN